MTNTVPPLFKTEAFREFAAEILGTEVDGLPIRQLVRQLEDRALAENWGHERDKAWTECRLCGWTALHAAVGPLWWVTASGQFFEHDALAAKRPNFRASSRGGGSWVCVSCLRRSLRHHPKSARVDKNTSRPNLETGGS